MNTSNTLQDRAAATQGLALFAGGVVFAIIVAAVVAMTLVDAV